MKKYLILIILSLIAQFTRAQTSVQDTTIYGSTVDVQAQFPGGVEELYKYIGNNLVYPKSARQDSVQGRVFVTFVIEKDGSTSNIKILRGLSPDINTEAIRVIQASPRWMPSKYQGASVRSQFTLPLNFKLDKPAVAEVFSRVEVNAEYPGGIEALYDYISTNMKYPAKARRDNVSGKVFVTLIVERDGSLTDVKILKSLSPETDEEALRVVKASQKWTPAKISGLPVRQQYSFPVNFILTDN